ncbi:hypothetical protein CANARDRAFT_196451 [[Candida] arabinofermentans NRRL YB-2248]|uniref:Major facilitator superfamily (MFS) profile domain-containing protein n=1 Tax=[Candida] arabinofermentans NRRL YB-2248 TaxID=983967 RepID=A0A1E4T3K7_9ASCO|nr:hypothetical protein CANARDRAFT_196451 [[Candida] arabinofermentans NRRL YB-2248]
MTQRTTTQQPTHSTEISVSVEQDNTSIFTERRRTFSRAPESELDYQENNDLSETLSLDYPDGGVRAYLVVFGSFLGLTVDFGIVNSIGAIQAYLNLHQFKNVSTSVTSLIFSLFTFFTYASIILSGSMFDELGARIPMAIGIVLFFIGFFACGSCNSVGSFIVTFSIIGGTSIGMLAGPLTGVISHWFMKNRAKAFGLCTLGSSVGGIMFPLLLDRLYKKLGFENAMRIIASLSTVLLIVATTLITERESIKNSNSSNVVEDYDNDASEVISIAGKLRTFGKRASCLAKKSTEFKAMRDPKYFFCVIGASFGELGLTCCLTYFASYVTFIGYSETKANTVITILNTIGIAGRYIPNIFADKIGSYNVMIIMALLVGLSTLLIWLAWSSTSYSMASIYTFAVLYGFFSSSVFSLAPSCVGSISPTKDFGKRYGTMFLFASVVLLVGMTIGGIIIGDESIESYRHFSLYCGLISLVSFVMFVCSRYCQAGFKMLKKV